MMKRIILLFAVLMLICSISVPVFAHDAPDLTRKGSIEITMQSGETAVGGGKLTLYRVGEVYEEDGNYSFVPTDAFAESGETFEDISSAELADRLASYADKNSVKGTIQSIDEKGKISFSELELGLYLLVQEEAAEGYNKVNPFLVSVPQMEDGAYVYEAEASPKVELTPAPVPPPDEPDEPDEPDKPDEPKLPQTGQLNWPVPTLALAGLTFFACGWVLCLGSKKEQKTK